MSSQVFWLTSWGLINIYPYKKEDYEDSRVYVVKETIKTDLDGTADVFPKHLFQTGFTLMSSTFCVVGHKRIALSKCEYAEVETENTEQFKSQC